METRVAGRSKLDVDGARDLERPDRRPCEPAEYGLNPDTVIARASELACLSFERRDPARQERFLTDFGLEHMKTDERGAQFATHDGGRAIVEIVEANRDRLESIAFALGSAEFDKAREVARREGIEPHGDELPIPAPGGIWLRLRKESERGQISASRPAYESSTPVPNRENAAWIAPSHIVKLGHVVLQSRDPVSAVRFFRRWLGLIPTDIQLLPSGRPVVVFMRLDKGAEPADHHTLVIAQSYKDGFDHAAFETSSLDDVGFGHQYLKAQGWQHSWGMGRHWLGGQFFDYWRDPAGAHFEHYSGSDSYTADYPAQRTLFSRGTLYSWGADLPGKFTGGPRLRELPQLMRSLWRGELDWKVLKEMQAAAKTPPRPWIR